MGLQRRESRNQNQQMSKMNVSVSRRLLPYGQVPQLSERDRAYAQGDERLRPFYRYAPSMEGFAEAIAARREVDVPREALVAVLREQYQGMDISPATAAHIDALLSERTFTVTTAHQPSLFTGPLYYIYKIISTLKLAQQLGEQFPDDHFVPLFITGGEDHDFEEVNHLNLFGKTITWESGESGAVSQMSASSLPTVLEAVQEVLGDSPQAKELSEMLSAAVAGKEKYGSVARDLTNRLLGEYGLVVLDPSHPDLKRLFIPYIKEEIFEQPSKALVEATVEKLEAAGFSGQAHPREINFFYLGQGYRERIVQEGGRYRVLNQEVEWSRTELEQAIVESPERFSPNVVMRPIYQELILPNLAYIGGGGELAYWLERKAQFDHFGIPFPVLVRRNSVLFVDQGTSKRLAKLDLSAEQLFGDIEALIKGYVREHTDNEISLAEEKEALEALFKQVEAKAAQVDPTLVKAAAAEGARQLNSMEQLEGKLMRAEKQRYDTAINQLRKLQEKLFPGHGLQERHDNFMTLYLRYGRGFFDLLMDALDPLETGFVLLVDE